MRGIAARLKRLAFGHACCLAIASLTLMVLATAPSAAADDTPPMPRAKPAIPAYAKYLGSGTRAQFADLFAAAQRQQWDRARALARRTGDPVAETLTEWLYLTDSTSRPKFAQIRAFLDANPLWPDRRALTKAAEELLPPSMTPSQIMAWFGGRAPMTGIGMVKLGEAQIALGNRADGEDLIRKAWADYDFPPAEERAVEKTHARLIAGAPTAQRLERLLAARRTTDATRVLDKVDSDAQHLARARISLIGSPARADRIVESLPGRLQDDPSLLLERMRAKGRAGDLAVALPLAHLVQPAPAAAQWWGDRHLLIRAAVKLGRYQDAYQLASTHGLVGGADFADAEWLAGWISLRFLGDAGTAFDHFQALYRNVSFPVSRARAAYWSARAAEEAGRRADAALLYEVASGFTTTFYGQLAAIRLQNNTALIALAPEAETDPSRRSSFYGSELVRAARLAGAAGEDSIVRRLITHLADSSRTADDFLLAGGLALDLGYPSLAVRVAKRAMQDNIVLPSLAFPIIGVGEGTASGMPEPALVLGLSRQESEFNTRAVSSAGARGLMQLMPKTAQAVAQQERLPYDLARLLDDPVYNAQLGSAYLRDLIQRFGGSYTLAVAGYNAGPNRVRQWMGEFGDPRDPKVDAIDWIETIPFNETRNYVQRVLENTQVYRERLNRSAVAIRLGDDLARPYAAPKGQPDLLTYLGDGAARPVAVATTEPRSTAAGSLDEATSRGRQAIAEPKRVSRKDRKAKPAPEPAPTGAAQTPDPTASDKAASDKVESVAAPASLAPTEVMPAGSNAPEEPLPPVTALAELAAPSANPFGDGQPETLGHDKDCRRMMLGPAGNIHCAKE